MENNDPLRILDFIAGFAREFPDCAGELPWQIISSLSALIGKKIHALSGEYRIQGDIAIHTSAKIEEHAVLKGPLIISAGCFVAAHAYLRGGVFLGDGVTLGPGCEIKSSMIFSSSVLAHFNFVGDSLIGAGVNMEAGSVIANCFNERVDKEVRVLFQGQTISTACNKFGAIVGDNARIGANAVLSPGTLLEPGTLVKRLELVEQLK